MSPRELRAIEARILREREERVTTTPARQVAAQKLPQNGGRPPRGTVRLCDCGLPARANAAECVACMRAERRMHAQSVYVSAVEIAAWARHRHSVTPADVEERFAVSRDAATSALGRMVRRGEASRVSMGVYVVTR